MLKAPDFSEIMIETLQNKNVNIFMDKLFAFCTTTPTKASFWNINEALLGCNGNKLHSWFCCWM